MGDVVLVVDVGGGIMDFFLVVVIEEDGNLMLNWIVVGDYIFLGGDNMDLVLVYWVKVKLEVDGKKF